MAAFVVAGIELISADIVVLRVFSLSNFERLLFSSCMHTMVTCDISSVHRSMSGYHVLGIYTVANFSIEATAQQSADVSFIINMKEYGEASVRTNERS